MRNIEVFTFIGLGICMCLLVTSSAYTLFPKCLDQCKECSQYYGRMYDTTGCLNDCRESHGGTMDYDCHNRIDISKRVGANIILECQMFCVDCKKLYGTHYNGRKCSDNCIKSRGKNMDYECTIHSPFG